MTTRPAAIKTVPDSPDGGAASWVDDQVERMADAWRRGERLTAAELMDGHPDLDNEDAVRLIYEEICLRREAGLDVPTSEVVRRYPKWRADLVPLLGFDRLISPSGASRPADYPNIGDRCGDFRLLAELGRGAAGRTFLAAQPSLADRPVVLKLTADCHDEHLSLARLQHTHIVPLYSEQSFPERGLRGLCMPYLGGASLARVLDDLATVPAVRRRGRDVMKALDRVSRAGPTVAPEPGPYRRFLAGATYPQAVCWIRACLADALDYAHAHDLIHMDVKPSNVLIAGDGQPMLLDFHLAGSPVRPGGEPPARLGGTPGWTSPEQTAAVRALAEGRPITRSVDGRADVYALGLLLATMLGAIPPSADRDAPPGRMPRLDRLNPQVGVGLADIVDRCLLPEPADRYQDAALLAEDLRRQLNDLPLRGVPNRSLVERWSKWRRRSPAALMQVLVRVGVIAAVLFLPILGWPILSLWLRAGASELDDARRLNTEGHYQEAAKAAQRGRALADHALFRSTLARDLKDQYRLADLGVQADALHVLAERFRYRAGAGPVASDELRALASRLKRLWDERARLLSADTDRLDKTTRVRLDADLTEIASIWADQRVRLAPAGDLTARREAFTVLSQVQAEFGARPALVHELRGLAAALGLPAPADLAAAEPRTAREHDDLGRSYLRDGNFAAALTEFRAALDLQPAAFWPNFYSGWCAYHLNRNDDALAAFHACVVLAPESAECRVNRALVAERLGHNDQAYHDLTRAH